MITLTDNQFNPNKNWSVPLEYNIPVSIQHPEWLDYFDQNGYRLTKLESHYAGANGYSTVNHRYEVCLRQDWFTGDKVLTGPHLNHAYLFERKGYEEAALQQLKEYVKENNLVSKLIKYKGKWGVDFSIDYVDSQGNSMELLHFEYDSFNYNEIQDIKGKVESTVKGIDWEVAAKSLLKRKNEWFSEDYFKQSKWKTDFFGLPAEQFKMIGWE
tara:strand:+ start:2280 stop:2918 length:639 start_codon:yes stop_codon:yes gene_type:complete